MDKKSAHKLRARRLEMRSGRVARPGDERQHLDDGRVLHHVPVRRGRPTTHQSKLTASGCGYGCWHGAGGWG